MTDNSKSEHDNTDEELIQVKMNYVDILNNSVNRLPIENSGHIKIVMRMIKK